MDLPKLVRDRIPEIIQESGREPELRQLSQEAYAEALDEKLKEELNEYLLSGELEELADLQEVLFAILAHRGVDREAFEGMRLAKRERNGGFAKRLCLVAIHPSEK